MKHVLHIIIFLVCTVSFLNRMSGQEHAGEYMDLIGENYTQYNEDLWAYTKTASHSKNARKIEKKRQELIQTTATIKRKVARMKGWEGDNSLRDSVVNYFGLVYNILNEDFGKVVDLEEIAENSYDLMEAYLAAKKEANTKLAEASDRLADHEDAFAQAHNVNLLEGEKSKNSQKLEQASKVIDYYNEVYLVFFKSYKQEAYMLDAVSIKDVNALLQNKNKLAQDAQEGMAKLKEVGAFKGDRTLVLACKEALDLYAKEATEAQAYLDYIFQQENFENIRKAFEAKKERDRTQEDVDQYNAAVNSYNDAANKANQFTDKFNKERSVALKNWNKGVNRFIDKHVP